MHVPFEKIPKEQLRAMMESFVLREGTDYGEHEVDFENKVRDLEERLRRQELLIVFDEASESFNLVTQEAFRQALNEN